LKKITFIEAGVSMAALNERNRLARLGACFEGYINYAQRHRSVIQAPMHAGAVTKAALV
jgi:hypothetical protein